MAGRKEYELFNHFPPSTQHNWGRCTVVFDLSVKKIIFWVWRIRLFAPNCKVMGLKARQPAPKSLQTPQNMTLILGAKMMS